MVSAAIGCTLALAACGSSNGSSAAQIGANIEKSLVAYSECMRSHGVPSFPDPGTGQGPNAFGMDGYTFNLPANVNTQSPAYQNANKACENLIPAASASAHGIPAKAKQAALAHARCMRQHGVSNYPDPTFSGNGVSQKSGGRDLNPQSAAFQAAEKACQPKH
jgi:hypothetical protein